METKPSPGLPSNSTVYSPSVNVVQVGNQKKDIMESEEAREDGRLSQAEKRPCHAEAFARS